MADTCILFLLLFTIFATLISHRLDGATLNDYILDYQPLHFDQTHLYEQHKRVKRSIDSYLRLTLKAYNRTFKVELQPSKSIFADNHELVYGSEPATIVDTSFIYDGNLEGDSTSSVLLSVIKGSLSGHIIIPGHTTYHIEPARNHFKHADFHSIIYPESQMNLDPYRHKRAASGICGDEDIYRKLKDKWRPVKDVHINYEKEVIICPV